MDYPFDIAVKVEKDDLERDDNGNIQGLLFDVEIKVEKEVLPNGESDWCTNLDTPGDLLEPLFFKQLAENLLHKCMLCHRCFTDEFSILRHNLDHLHVVISNPTLFQCDYCNAYFTDKHTMNQHISLPECHTINQSNLPCENPSKTFALKYKPKAYIPVDTSAITDVTRKYEKTYKATHVKKLKDGVTNLLKYRPKACRPVPKTKQLHECIICNKMYTYKHWHAHMLEVHGDGGFYCGLCKLEFKCERYFMNHMRKRHQERFDPQKKMPERKKPAKKQEIKGYDKIDVKCDECDTVLQSLYALKTHKRNVHSNEKYVCSICKSILKCKSYLLAHMRRVHYDDGKTHACECGKKFRSPRYLAVHKKNAHQRKNK